MANDGAAAAAAPAPAAAPSAGESLGGGGAAAPPSWFSEFKSPELKSYVQERKFTSPEQMAERYLNLEKMRGVPDDKLIRLPDKMEGEAARAVFERLGAPKEAKEYELPRGEAALDKSFADWAEGIFHKEGVTKTQALEIAKAYDGKVKQDMQAAMDERKLAITQGTAKLAKEWGAAFEQNKNIAAQGAKILGVDAKTLDLLEAVQGTEALYKTLHKIGVGLGESNFVDGQAAPASKTPEQAQDEIKQLMTDRKFQKAFNKGDKEAMDRWNHLNKVAFPGEKPIG